MASTPRKASPAPVDGDTESHERELVDRLRRGDEVAFEQLYRAYWMPLYSFAFRYVRSADEAEEVVQDVFCRIWRLHAELNPRGSVRDYLYLAVRNGALNRLDHEAVVRRWTEQHVASLHDGVSESAQGTTILESAELDAIVVRALAELPAKRRAICALRLTDGLSYAQIADRLGIAQKTVETQLARGIRFLRERLADVARE